MVIHSNCNSSQLICTAPLILNCFQILAVVVCNLNFLINVDPGADAVLRNIPNYCWVSFCCCLKIIISKCLQVLIVRLHFLLYCDSREALNLIQCILTREFMHVCCFCFLLFISTLFFIASSQNVVVKLLIRCLIPRFHSKTFSSVAPYSAISAVLQKSVISVPHESRSASVSDRSFVFPLAGISF